MLGYGWYKTALQKLRVLREVKMALTKCKDCKTEMSKKAKSCPKCGAPAKKKTSFLTWLVLILIGFGFVGYVVGNKDIQEKKSAESKYFNANKSVIIDGIGNSIESGKHGEALQAVERYLHTGDLEIKALHKKLKVELIVSELKAVPASDFKKNKELYGQLVELNPGTEKYKEKLDFYSKKAARQDLVEKQFSPWDGSHAKLERLIKGAMNDPDSYEHDKTTYSDMGDHLVVKTVYRGKNGFGGMVRNFITAKVGLGGQIIKVIDQT